MKYILSRWITIMKVIQLLVIQALSILPTIFGILIMLSPGDDVATKAPTTASSPRTMNMPKIDREEEGIEDPCLQLVF